MSVRLGTGLCGWWRERTPPPAASGRVRYVVKAKAERGVATNIHSGVAMPPRIRADASSALALAARSLPILYMIYMCAPTSRIASHDTRAPGLRRVKNTPEEVVCCVLCKHSKSKPCHLSTTTTKTKEAAS